MTNAFRRTVERRNKMVRWPISPTETSAQLTPFRLIAPLGEKLIVYLAKKLTFATPGPRRQAEAHRCCLLKEDTGYQEPPVYLYPLCPNSKICAEQYWAKPPQTSAQMRIFYPIFRRWELAAG